MDKLSIIITNKHMPFAFLAGDLPVYIIITTLKAENTNKYRNIVPFLDPFHTHCVMMNAIYKRYKNSGLEDLLVAAGVIAEGSAERALKGKHYKRGLRCLSLMYEALLCQLLRERLTPHLSSDVKDKLGMMRDTSQPQQSRTAAHGALLDDEDLSGLITSMLTHVQDSDMAHYWAEFLNMTDALMQNVHAIHVSDWDEFLNSLHAMLPWMVAYDNNNYGRWLPDFWAMLSTLPPEMVAFLRNNFAQSISGRTYSNIPWDMWIECTMNKGSKMKSGWLSILQNEKQLLVHSRNVNNVVRIRAALNDQANRKNVERYHVECSPSRMKADEQCVQDLISCMHEFESFPFDPSLPTLRTLQSALPASDELVSFHSAHARGLEKVNTFLQERVFSKNVSIHAPISLTKCLTFVKGPVTLRTGENCKARETEMEQNAFKAVIHLVEVSQLIDLHDLLEYRIVDECMALFNSNGTHRKTQKSKLLQKLSMNIIELHEPYTAIVDMGMIWRLATPSAEDRQTQDGMPYKWSNYAHKVASIILARHSDADRIVCVNDQYDFVHSTKEDERNLRTHGHSHVPNIYMKLGDPFPSDRTFKMLLCSNSNEQMLQKLMSDYLTEVSRDFDVVVIYSVGTRCTNLSTQQVMPEYSFDQSEADTVITSMYTLLREMGYSGPVVIDAADTDVYVAAAVISHQQPGVLCIKKKHDLISCNQLVPVEMSVCLVQFHCFTGCDGNSGFYGKGKKSLYQLVEKSPVAKRLLMHCGDSLNMAEDVIEDLFQFTRHIIYGDNKSTTMAESHAAKWKQMKNKTFLRLPPDADSLRQHCLRANYLSYLMRHPSLKNHPSPIGHGWQLVDGHCRPVHHRNIALPRHLTMPGAAEENNDTDDESELERGEDGSSDESDNVETSEEELEWTSVFVWYRSVSG